VKKQQNSAECTKKAKKSFSRFMAFLSNQNKLVMAEDMIRSNSFNYTYIDRLNTSRCILCRGILTPDMIKPEFNAQLNIEVTFFGGTAGCFAYILYHKNGERLDKPSSWVWDRGGIT
jgi:hypothetical protein